MRELQSIQEDPIEGFKMLHVDDSNIFDWQVAIFGPPGTTYGGGYFKAHIRFPGDYPFSAPSFRFLTKIWHPNIYENGEVCISILHPPINDPQGGELPGERWNPTQSVRTVLISIISLLNEPNTYSPANVDASVAYRNWKEGKDNKYKEIISKQISDSQTEAQRDGVHIPMTQSEYCIKSKLDSSNHDIDFDMDDDDDLDDEYDEDEEYASSANMSNHSVNVHHSKEEISQEITTADDIPEEMVVSDEMNPSETT